MFAGLTKKNIERGKWRFLNEKKFVNLNTLEKENSSQNTRMDTEKAYIKISDHIILDHTRSYCTK